METAVRNKTAAAQHDELDREIAELRERLRQLRAQKRAAKQRKFRREEIAAILLKEYPQGMYMVELINETEKRYVNQGRKAAPKRSGRAVKRLVQLGVMLGVLEVDNGKVFWKNNS